MNKLIILGLLLFQAVCFYLLASGVWQGNTWWVGLGLAVAYFSLPIRFSIPALILGLAFSFPAIRPWSDTFQLWRLLSGVVFVRVLIFEPRFFSGIINEAIKRRWPIWLKWFLGFGVLAFVSLFWSLNPLLGISRLLLCANGGLVAILAWYYVVHYNEQALLKSLFLMSGFIALFGIFQYIFASLDSLYYFWQYWAEVVARQIYGSEIANVLIYSNSWFTQTSDGLVLRMFSFMPDSHSFALVCLIGLCCSVYLFQSRIWLNVYKFIGVSFLFGIGIVFSGTRGVWFSGLVTACVLLAAIYLYPMLRKRFKSWLVVFGLLVLTFLISPFLRLGLTMLVSSSGMNDFARARSILNINESSNAGRLAIWQESLMGAIRYPIGVGYNNFVLFRLESRANLTPESINPRYNLPEKYITAHSLYLQILVELGFMGLAFFLLGLAGWFLSFRQVFLNENNFKESRALFMSVFFVLLLWLSLFSLFDVTIYNDKILFLICVFLGIYIAYEEKNSRPIGNL